MPKRKVRVLIEVEAGLMLVRSSEPVDLVVRDHDYIGHLESEPDPLAKFVDPHTDETNYVQAGFPVEVLP